MPTCDQRGEAGTCRAGLGEAGEERTFGETLTCTPKKSTALKIERLDLEGHLQGRGQGALPGVSRWRPSYLFGRKRQLFLHCVLVDTCVIDMLVFLDVVSVV